jgi:hypothetical protein
MIEICLSSDQWVNSDVPFAYHQSSLWLALIGISNVGSLWTDGDEAVIAALGTYLVEIEPRVLQDRDHSRRLVTWLREPSAKPIRLQMLNMLSLAAADATDYWWEEQSLRTAIARYLNVLWDEHRQEIKADTELRDKFETLLHSIAIRHEPLALELQKRISSR